MSNEDYYAQQRNLCQIWLKSAVNALVSTNVDERAFEKALWAVLDQYVPKTEPPKSDIAPHK